MRLHVLGDQSVGIYCRVLTVQINYRTRRGEYKDTTRLVSEATALGENRMSGEEGLFAGMGLHKGLG